MDTWRLVMETNRLSRPSGCPLGVSQPFHILGRFPFWPLNLGANAPTPLGAAAHARSAHAEGPVAPRGSSRVPVVGPNRCATLRQPSGRSAGDTLFGAFWGVLGLFWGVLGMFWACSERGLDGWVTTFRLPYNCSRWAFGVL